jgi:hypothetical protein
LEDAGERRRGGPGNEDGEFAPLESLDGKFLYYAKALYSTSLWKIPIEGGEASKVLESLSAFQNVAIVVAVSILSLLGKRRVIRLFSS